MNRIECKVFPGGSGVAWVDTITRQVWNHPAGGTRWKNKVEWSGSGNVWEYPGPGGTLVLVGPAENETPHPGGQPQCVPAPIGLRPADIAWREMDRQRCEEIGQAIARYSAVLEPIPEEWLDELDELTTRNQPEAEHAYPTQETTQ